MYNVNTPMTAVPAKKDQTLLESMGCCPHDTTEMYIKALDQTIAGDISPSTLKNMSFKKCLKCRG